MEEVCERCAGVVGSEGACLDCGFQGEDREFVWNPTFAEDGQICGQAVGENGNNIGNNGKNASYKGLAKQATEDNYNARAEGTFKHICTQLDIPKDVREDGKAYMNEVRPDLSGPGRMSHNKLASACLYVAIRNHKLAISLEELSKKALLTRPELGAAYNKVLGILHTMQPEEALIFPTEYLNFIRRHASMLEPLTKSKKQGAVESTFMELMHWVEYSDRVQHAASTPVLAAAVFTIALQAHQVKVKRAVILAVFELSSQASVPRRIAEIKAMLTDTARLLPWLSKVDPKHIVQHVSTIVKVPMQTKQFSPSPSPVVAQNSRQTTQSSKPSRKRRLAACQNDAEVGSGVSSDLSTASHMSKRSKTATRAADDECSDEAVGSSSHPGALSQMHKRSKIATEAVDDESFYDADNGSSDPSPPSRLHKRSKTATEATEDESFDDAIADDELEQYIHRTDEVARLLLWEAHQEAMYSCK